MFAATAVRLDADNPLTGLELGEHAEPTVPDGWTTVTVRATALNHHDVWSLRGVGLAADKLPMILGCDAAGTDAEGNDVVSMPLWATRPRPVVTRPSIRGGRCCPSATTEPLRSSWRCRGATWCRSPPRCRSGKRRACRLRT